MRISVHGLATTAALFSASLVTACGSQSSSTSGYGSGVSIQQACALMDPAKKSYLDVTRKYSTPGSLRDATGAVRIVTQCGVVICTAGSGYNENGTRNRDDTGRRTCEDENAPAAPQVIVPAAPQKKCPGRDCDSPTIPQLKDMISEKPSVEQPTRRGLFSIFAPRPALVQG